MRQTTQTGHIYTPAGRKPFLSDWREYIYVLSVSDFKKRQPYFQAPICMGVHSESSYKMGESDVFGKTEAAAYGLFPAAD